MQKQQLQELHAQAEQGEPISGALALAVLEAGPETLTEIFTAAETMRQKHFSRRMVLCAIVNGKCGNCSEDCSFCAQSCRSTARIETYPLREPGEFLAARETAARHGVSFFSIVTSGKALTDRELDRLGEMVRSAEQANPGWCCSLGCLTREQLARLKAAGFARYHHNLETAASFFEQVCTTHAYADRVRTIRDAKAVGLEVCAGGIFGIGESKAQRVELALALAEEEVDSIPLNFLVPIDGTPLAGTMSMEPIDILLTIAMFRLTNPTSEIRIAGGREHLRDLQTLIPLAGGNGLMIGDLLTVSGGQVERDLQWLKDLDCL
jgi:biotin synthase